MENTVHFVLQAKGGIGKSFISTLLAQHLINETGAVRCFDTDQENTTFAHYEALSVRHVTVADQSRLIDPKKFDALMETLLTEEGNFVIDTGANTFSNLLAYMIENEVFPLLKDAGKTVYVHTIVGGGDTLADTANGFYAIAQRVNGTRVVVWFNEHFGDINTADGKPFIETQAYKQSAPRLAGAVTLFKRNAATYGADIRKLNTQRHTISQALASSDYTLMEKQRIKTFGRDVFDQLRALPWVNDNARLRATIFERSGIAIDEHDPIMAVLVASAQQTEEIGARLLRRVSPVRAVVAAAITALVFATIGGLVTWRVEQRLFAVERAEWMRQQSDPRREALLRSGQGMAALALAESGVAELLAKCNGRPSWRIEGGYCIPLTADGKPDGFRVGDRQARLNAGM